MDLEERLLPAGEQDPLRCLRRPLAAAGLLALASLLSVLPLPVGRQGILPIPIRQVIRRCPASNYIGVFARARGALAACCLPAHAELGQLLAPLIAQLVGPSPGVVHEHADLVFDTVHHFDMLARGLEVPLTGVSFQSDWNLCGWNRGSGLV